MGGCVHLSLDRHPLGRHPLGKHPPGRHPPTTETATEAGGTHPTGMHCCCCVIFLAFICFHILANLALAEMNQHNYNLPDVNLLASTS